MTRRDDLASDRTQTYTSSAWAIMPHPFIPLRQWLQPSGYSKKAYAAVAMEGIAEGLLTLRKVRKPSSSGSSMSSARPLPPLPRAVRPTRWMYSFGSSGGSYWIIQSTAAAPAKTPSCMGEQIWCQRDCRGKCASALNSVRCKDLLHVQRPNACPIVCQQMPRQRHYAWDTSSGA